LQTDYVVVVEDRLIMSIKYCLPVPFFHFLARATSSRRQRLFIGQDFWAYKKRQVERALVHGVSSHTAIIKAGRPILVFFCICRT